MGLQMYNLKRTMRSGNSKQSRNNSTNVLGTFCFAESVQFQKRTETSPRLNPSSHARTHTTRTHAHPSATSPYTHTERPYILAYTVTRDISDMRTFALTAALAGAGGLSSLVAAASVEAGTLTTVTAEAPLYDPRQSDQYGCSPSGCVAGLTRVRGCI